MTTSGLREGKDDLGNGGGFLAISLGRVLIWQWVVLAL